MFGLLDHRGTPTLETGAADEDERAEFFRGLLLLQLHSHGSSKVAAARLSGIVLWTTQIKHPHN